MTNWMKKQNSSLHYALINFDQELGKHYGKQEDLQVSRTDVKKRNKCTNAEKKQYLVGIEKIWMNGAQPKSILINTSIYLYIRF